MIRDPIPTWLFIVLGTAGIAIALLVYSGLVVRQTKINPNQTVLPGAKAFWEGVKMVTKSQGSAEKPKPPWIVEDFRATYWRLFLGLLVGIAMSVVIGIAMGAYTAAEAFFSPLITFFAKIPPTAMLAVYMVVFGTHLKAYVALVAFGIFFTMVHAIYQAVKKDVASEMIDKAYTLGASELEVILEVIWLQVLPRVIENVRLQIGPAMVFLIAAEMLFGSEGFGYRIGRQSRLLNMNVVYIYLCVLGLSGLVIDWLLVKLRRWLCPWFGD